MPTQQTYRRRLKKLANHLRTLPPNRWNFRTMTYPCGCAIGQTPGVFPTLVTTRKNSLGDTNPVTISGASQYTTIAQELFNLNEVDATQLFNYNRNGGSLPVTATAIDVANNIDKYLKETKCQKQIAKWHASC